MMLYRHMEADGVPHGYEAWPRIGVVRNPVERLWSLYRFLNDVGRKHYAPYVEAQRACVQMNFSDWVVSNLTVFTNQYDSAGFGRIFPQYTVRHSIPENRKSQHFYLRPDLGTVIFDFNNLGNLAARLKVTLPLLNATDSRPVPPLKTETIQHIERWFPWDLEATNCNPWNYHQLYKAPEGDAP